MFSFYVDLYPAVKTKGQPGFKEKGMPNGMSDRGSTVGGGSDRYGSGTDMEEGVVGGGRGGEHLARPDRERRNETARPGVVAASNF